MIWSKTLIEREDIKPRVEIISNIFLPHENMQQKTDGKKTDGQSINSSSPSLAEKLKWMFKNLKYTTFLCCFKFRLQSNISLLQFQILKLREKFGVDYMTLISENASVEDLKECLRTALQEIIIRQDKIEENLNQIDQKELQMNNKMRKIIESVDHENSVKVTTDKLLKNHPKRNSKRTSEYYHQVSDSSYSSFSVNCDKE